MRCKLPETKLTVFKPFLLLDDFIPDSNNGSLTKYWQKQTVNRVVSTAEVELMKVLLESGQMQIQNPYLKESSLNSESWVSMDC